MPAGSSVLNTKFSFGHIDREHVQRPPHPRFSQLGTRGWSQHHDSFCHSTTEVLYNHHHNGQIATPPYHPAYSYRDMPNIPSVRPMNHHGFADSTALQSDS